MKKLRFGILLAIVLFPSIAKSQDKNGFEITGHIDGVEDGEKVLLRHYPFTWIVYSPFSPITIDSCIVKNGEFHFHSVDTADGPHFYHLAFQWPKHHLNAILDSGAMMTCKFLIANGEHIFIHGGNIDKFPERDISRYVGIDGSPSNLAFNDLEAAGQAFDICISRIDKAISKIKETVGFDKSMVGAYLTARDLIANNSINAFLRSSESSWKPAFPILMINLVDGLNHASIIMDAYNSLDGSQKNSYWGKRLKIYADVSIGQVFPSFTLPNPEGKPVALKNIVSKSKLTVVHIWGSESFDRAKYQDELRRFYKKYHEKGLDIIGVSADTASYVFKGFTSEQNYPWENVSDLKGWNNRGMRKSIIEDVFLEGGHDKPNTTNVLLDNTGKIIAWDANGVELQYYLEKYFGD